MASSKTANFDKFLKEHNAVKGEGFTHTRIGDQNLSIYGGSYNINENDWSSFMQLYYQHVFVNGNKEYLTEKQLIAVQRNLPAEHFDVLDLEDEAIAEEMGMYCTPYNPEEDI